MRSEKGEALLIGQCHEMEQLNPRRTEGGRETSSGDGFRFCTTTLMQCCISPVVATVHFNSLYYLALCINLLSSDMYNYEYLHLFAIYACTEYSRASSSLLHWCLIDVFTHRRRIQSVHISNNPTIHDHQPCRSTCSLLLSIALRFSTSWCSPSSLYGNGNTPPFSPSSPLYNEMLPIFSENGPFCCAK